MEKDKIIIDLESKKQEKEYLNQSYNEIRDKSIEMTRPLIEQFINNDPVLKNNLVDEHIEVTIEFMTNRVAGYIVGLLKGIREKV